MPNLFTKKMTKDQCRDTGMAMVLLLLILFAYRKREGWLAAAVIVHVVNMTVPKIYRPVAAIWLTLSDLLGAVASKVLMGIIYIVVVSPIALIRRLAGKDSLNLRIFRAGQDSVMLQRNHLFSARDLERPY